MNIVTRKDFEELIPPLTPPEFQRLEANLVEDGCREPLVVWHPPEAEDPDTVYVVDGHNRFRICTAHDLPYTTTQKEFDNESAVKAWIILNQRGRRNLTPSQLTMLATELASIYKIKAKQRQVELAGSRPNTPSDLSANLPEGRTGEAREHAARAMNISPRSVSMGKKVRERCIPRVTDEVIKGNLTVAAAEQIATLSVQEQGELADAGVAALKKRAGEIRQEREVQKHQSPEGNAEDVEIWDIRPVNEKAKGRLKDRKRMTTHELRRFVEEIDVVIAALAEASEDDTAYRDSGLCGDTDEIHHESLAEGVRS